MLTVPNIERAVMIIELIILMPIIGTTIASDSDKKPIHNNSAALEFLVDAVLYKEKAAMRKHMKIRKVQIKSGRNSVSASENGL